MALKVKLQLQQQEEDHGSSGDARSKSTISDGACGGGDDIGFISGSTLARFHRTIPVTLDLFHSNLASFPIELEEPSPLPLGWQKCLDLKTGSIYYTQDKTKKHSRDETTMSRNGKSPKLDLKLNLSPPRSNPLTESPNRSATSSPISPPSSCVSTELNAEETLRYSNSPEATSMVLVGCPRCLMYVMLSEEDPKCPKCKSTVLLDFLQGNNNNNNNNNYYYNNTKNKKTRKG